MLPAQGDAAEWTFHLQFANEEKVPRRASLAESSSGLSLCPCCPGALPLGPTIPLPGLGAHSQLHCWHLGRNILVCGAARGLVQDIHSAASLGSTPQT